MPIPVPVTFLGFDVATLHRAEFTVDKILSVGAILEMRGEIDMRHLKASTFVQIQKGRVRLLSKMAAS
jgi:hypothetical protein